MKKVSNAQRFIEMLQHLQKEVVPEVPENFSKKNNEEIADLLRVCIWQYLDFLSPLADLVAEAIDRLREKTPARKEKTND